MLNTNVHEWSRWQAFANIACPRKSQISIISKWYILTPSHSIPDTLWVLGTMTSSTLRWCYYGSLRYGDFCRHEASLHVASCKLPKTSSSALRCMSFNLIVISAMKFKSPLVWVRVYCARSSAQTVSHVHRRRCKEEKDFRPWRWRRHMSGAGCGHQIALLLLRLLASASKDL